MRAQFRSCVGPANAAQAGQGEGHHGDGRGHAPLEPAQERRRREEEDDVVVSSAGLKDWSVSQ